MTVNPYTNNLISPHPKFNKKIKLEESTRFLAIYSSTIKYSKDHRALELKMHKSGQRIYRNKF